MKICRTYGAFLLTHKSGRQGLRPTLYYAARTGLRNTPKEKLQCLTLLLCHCIRFFCHPDKCDQNVITDKTTNADNDIQTHPSAKGC